MKNGNGKVGSSKGGEKERGLGTYTRLGAAITAFEEGKLPRGTKLVEDPAEDTYALVAPVKSEDDEPHVFVQVSRGDMIRFLAKRCGLAIRFERA